MALTFKRAVKEQSFLRMALTGPSGAGKTFTALLLATALAGDKPVAVIDTERGSASKYADMFGFDVLELDTFHPDRYVEAIQAAVAAGYGVVVIDSLSHAWNGTGGALELHDQAVKRQKTSNSYTAWADITPLQNRLVNTITGAPLHVIATMRSKTEYVQEKNANGGTTIRKVGMAPIQRDGMEYEFDIVGDLDQDHLMVISKTRCSALAGAVIAKPGQGVADILTEWLRGEATTPARVAAPEPLTPAAPVAPQRAVQRPAPVKPAPASAAAAQWQDDLGYNPLADLALMKRFKAVGADTVAKVEAALAKVKAKGEYSRTTIYAYLARVEEIRREQGLLQADTSADRADDVDADDADDADEPDLYDLRNLPEGERAS